MTGGGFGGSAVALVPVDALDAVEVEVAAAFARAGHAAPACHRVRAGGGAARSVPPA